MQNYPIVWSIAGSDCSGGAGIQADIKTMHNLGCDVSSVVTANTAQNSFGVQEINAVSLEVLLSQLDALAIDRPPQVIKIGMLANVEQIHAISQWLVDYAARMSMPKVIYDPVAIASAGGNLAEEDILPAIREKLLPLVDVLTPNANEAQRLSGVYIINWQSMLDATQALMAMGVGSVALKGGHIDIDKAYCVDMADNGSEQFWLASKRIDTEHSHGSGCTYASAIAALFAQGYLLRDAVTVAKAYINQGLRLAQHYQGAYGPIRQGHWPNCLDDYPIILQSGSELAERLDWQQGYQGQFKYADNFADCGSLSLGLYPVVGDVQWIERLAPLGVQTIQLRLKNLPIEQIELQISQAVALSNQYGFRLFINDYWQLAIKHQAYGVHLGQEDLAEADLHAIKQAGLRLGISTHGEYELLAAKQLQPSYLAVGAIYPTKTKDMTGQIQGITRLERYLDLVDDLPVVAIGGINMHRAQQVKQTGVGSIALVTAITEAESPEDAFKQLQRIVEGCR
ncbi:phosphomethylpyrimidine kinase/thiamin-phosphate pyrophosphorylase [Catenovulum agarivorans DS-2]|uniref:Thiamine-phosphate synthase n=1 Tax=Catenovulum agarivorans DS-2 TaxID=1328313 RepID=W7Q873_9ALTE|nr:thiamine phosphate synthase [Catenovulum agarivorans]EWH08171.1 phosphomethylpyrimidine kinase/thiamin-phosphate pyrophosphorylase [Catenovulum agarivorans DS-2]